MKHPRWLVVAFSLASSCRPSSVPVAQVAPTGHATGSEDAGGVDASASLPDSQPDASNAPGPDAGRDAGTHAEDAGRDAGGADTGQDGGYPSAIVWEQASVIDTSPIVSYSDARLAIGPDGAPMAAWLAENGGTAAIVSGRWDAGTWSTEWESAPPFTRYGPFEVSDLLPDGPGDFLLAWRVAPGSFCFPRVTSSTVTRWDGSAWSNLGSDMSGFDAGDHYTETLRIARAPDGGVFAAFSQIPPDQGCSTTHQAEDSLVFLQAFDGAAWSSVGPPVYDAGFGWVEDLGVGDDGTPVLFYDVRPPDAGGTQAFATEWVDGGWNPLSPGPLCTDCTFHGALLSHGQPIVATQASNRNGQGPVEVKELNGSTWVTILGSVPGDLAALAGQGRVVALLTQTSQTPPTLWILDRAHGWRGSSPVPSMSQSDSLSFDSEGSVFVIGTSTDERSLIVVQTTPFSAAASLAL